MPQLLNFSALHSSQNRYQPLITVPSLHTWIRWARRSVTTPQPRRKRSSRRWTVRVVRRHLTGPGHAGALARDQPCRRVGKRRQPVRRVPGGRRGDVGRLATRGLDFPRTGFAALRELLKDTALAGEWILDPLRLTVSLKNRSMCGLAPVHGVFRQVTGKGTVSPAGEVSGAITVVAASIDTKNIRRDAHLRWADFFDSDTIRTSPAPPTRSLSVINGLATRNGCDPRWLRGLTRQAHLATLLRRLRPAFARSACGVCCRFLMALASHGHRPPSTPRSVAARVRLFSWKYGEVAVTSAVGADQASWSCLSLRSCPPLAVPSSRPGRAATAQCSVFS
jgi:hypothetical protein